MTSAIPRQLEDSFARLRRTVSKCLNDFSLIEDGDRILIAVSGGKDSTLLLMLLDDIRKRSPISFEIHPLLIDQGQPGFNVQAYRDWLLERGFNLEVLTEDTYSIVLDKTLSGKSFCGLCSRLRRGILYSIAMQRGFNKVALGHHREDLNETLLMNLFYKGRLATMPPKLKAKGKPVTVIRPMAYVAEEDLKQLAKQLEIPVMPCNLCGSQDGAVRREIKQLLQQQYRRYPHSAESILGAMGNIKKSHLLQN